MGRGVGRFWRGPGRSTGEDLLGSADGGGRINLLLSFFYSFNIDLFILFLHN